MLFLKRPKHCSFDYTPRFYDPEKDKSEDRKKRLKFRYNRASKRKTTSPIIFLVLAVVVVFLYLRFSGYVWSQETVLQISPNKIHLDLKSDVNKKGNLEMLYGS